MCEILAISSRYSITAKQFLLRFAKHGVQHSDGWGIARFIGSAAQVIREIEPADESKCMQVLASQSCSSNRIVAHIRKATIGAVALCNTQPFQREIGGKSFVFAHNGDLKGLIEAYSKKNLHYQPVGKTDSELAFCVLADRLWRRIEHKEKMDLNEIFDVFRSFSLEMKDFGPANFVLASDSILLVHSHIRTQKDKTLGPPGLYMLQQTDPDPPQKIVLFASVPLVEEMSLAKNWEPLLLNETILVQNGEVIRRESNSLPIKPSLFERFASEFIGLDRKDPVVTLDGKEKSARRIYLDTTATALMPKVVWEGLKFYLSAAQANSHTQAHRAGRDTTQAIEDSRSAIGRLVGYDPKRDVVLFVANGATGAINFLARMLFPTELRWLIKHFPEGPPEKVVSIARNTFDSKHSEFEARCANIDRLLARPLVVTSVMEHHSNLLPWMEAVGTHNVRAVRIDPETGGLDLNDLKQILERDGSRVRVVAIQAVSNVTGIINPVAKIAKLAHAVGAKIAVDGAQWIPHSPVAIHNKKDPEASIDFIVLSGHKMYAPGSRGILIGELGTFDSTCCVNDVGGGMVEYVSLGDVEVKNEITAREEAGTPNILGSISMGFVAEIFMKIGMENIEKQEKILTKFLLNTLENIDGISVYGSTNMEFQPRAGVVSFNIDGVYHSLVAAYLNDFHNIAVRNGCFCAQPYVKRLLGITNIEEQNIHEHILEGDRRRVPGMIRASLGVYSTKADIIELEKALRFFLMNKKEIFSRYTSDIHGDYFLKKATLPQTFNVKKVIDEWAK